MSRLHGTAAYWYCTVSSSFVCFFVFRLPAGRDPGLSARSVVGRQPAGVSGACFCISSVFPPAVVLFPHRPSSVSSPAVVLFPTGRRLFPHRPSSFPHRPSSFSHQPSSVSSPAVVLSPPAVAEEVMAESESESVGNGIQRWPDFLCASC